MQMSTYRNPILFVLAVALSAVLAHAQNDIVSIGYTAPAFPVATGQVVTLFTPVLNVPDAVANQVPLPTSLSGVSVSVRVVGQFDSTGYPTSLPILQVYTDNPCERAARAPCPNTQITVEIPTEGVCAPVSRPCPVPFTDIPPTLILNVKANGVTGPDLPVEVGQVFPHLLTSCDSIFGPPAADCYALITHADGTLVSFASPATVGETISIYAVGLNYWPGAPIRFPKTGYPADTPVEIGSTYAQVVFSYLVPPGPGAHQLGYYAPVGYFISPQWVGLTPGFVGLFQINVTVPPMPAGTPPCEGTYNTTISLQVLSSGTVYTCVQAQPHAAADGTADRSDVRSVGLAGRYDMLSNYPGLPTRKLVVKQ